MSADIANDEDLSDQHNHNDVELRDLVYQSLERDGIIALLKAQLRTAVFKTIEKASNSSDIAHKPAFEGQKGQICRALVLDWLDHSRLLYTQDIFQVETSGPSYPPPLTHAELLQHLHLNSTSSKSEPILHALLDPSNKRENPDKINSLPDHIRQSIDMKFPNEKINDINRLRDHFRSLFSFTFDSNILDIFLNKNISSISTSVSKSEYEQICLKWIQACSNALLPSSSSDQPSLSTVPPSSKSIVNNSQQVTRARRATSPPSDSSSSSSNSSSEEPRKGSYDFQLPTIMGPIKNIVKKSTDINPPTLSNFNNNSTNEDDDESTSSIFSRRNATPAALAHLKNMEEIAHGDETPRTRTNVQKIANNGHKDMPVEYDDESISQSQMSSIDDVTVDKASPSPPIHIDFLEDL